MNKSKQLTVLLVLALTVSCVKQTPEMPPGQAILQNLKTGIHAAQIAVASAKDAVQGDSTAAAVLSDVDKTLTVLDEKIEPYTSFDSSNAAQIKAAVKDALDTLRALQESGVTHIKNEKTRARVKLGLDLAAGALSLWQPAPTPVKLDL